MEKIVKQTLLYDFYGELLTEHQRRIYEEVVFDDFSVSEVAKDEGISRQGVHDMIKRCNRILSEYEKKLKLVEKFLLIQDKVKQIRDLSDPENTGDEKLRFQKIDALAARVLEDL